MLIKLINITGASPEEYKIALNMATKSIKSDRLRFGTKTTLSEVRNITRNFLHAYRARVQLGGEMQTEVEA